MKTILLILILVPQLGWTKIDNFSEMIVENAGTQKQIHKDLKSSQGWKDADAKAQPRLRKDVLESAVTNYSPKTKKSLLTYRKEKVDHHKKRFVKDQKRVTAELNDLQEEF